MFRGSRGLIMVVAVMCLLCVSARGMCQEQVITNPVSERGADPWVIKKDGMYYYCYSRGGGIWVNQSERIQDVVQGGGTAIWKPEPNKEYSEELWAPELFFLAGKWYVYVAADDGENKNHRMYVLESDTADAMGTYTFRGKIAATTDKWAIDGTVLEHGGELYFIWSGWEGDVNVQQNLYIARMRDPLAITGERVLISEPEYDWEKIGNPLINEGPEVLVKDGRVFVIYSASGSWTDNYCLGQLTLVGKDPMNSESWEKKITPVFSSTGTVFAPGHASFTKSPDGTEDWIVYHAAREQGSGWKRNVRMQQFTWDIEGNPCFGYPVSENVEIPAPSE